MFVIARNALRRDFKSSALLVGNTLQGQLQPSTIQYQIGHAIDLQSIKTSSIFNQRGITALTHRRNDFFNAVIYCLVGYPFPRQQRIQMLGKIALIGIQSGDFQRRVHKGYLQQ